MSKFTLIVSVARRDVDAHCSLSSVANFTVHATLLGGAVGRQAYLGHAVEAAMASKRVGAPVKLARTREDETHNHDYRPISVPRMRTLVTRMRGLDA
jgi:isoquinoline 1-oxidoreductase subunit beta